MNTPGGNNPSGGKTWPQWRIDKLRVLWANGLPASKIAEILGGGMTRNGVIGAARRAGCPPRMSPIVRLSAEQRAAKLVARPAPMKRGPQIACPLLLPFTTPAMAPARSPADVQPRIVPDVAPRSRFSGHETETSAHSVSMADLKFDQCAWVIAPGAYPVIARCCGSHVAAGNQQLCDRHRRQSWGRGTPSEQRALAGVA